MILLYMIHSVDETASLVGGAEGRATHTAGFTGERCGLVQGTGGLSEEIVALYLASLVLQQVEACPYEDGRE